LRFLIISAVNSEVVAEPKSRRQVREGREKSFRMTLRTAHIGSSDLASVDNVEGGGGDFIGNRVESGNGLSGLVDFGIRKPNDGTYPRCLSSIVAERIMAAGLALLVPMISLATCRQPGSKRAYS